VARAEKIENPTQNWTFELAGTWTEGDAAEEPGVLKLWHQDETDRILVLSRLRGNTDAVYSDRDGARETFFDSVEAGVKAQQPGYRRVERTVRELGKGKRKTRALDLWYRCGEGKERRLVGTRFLFFRTIGFMLTLEAPAATRVDRGSRKLLESFVPIR
jgi:hypothetical protein